MQVISVLLISVISVLHMVCPLHLQKAPGDLPAGFAPLSESGLKKWELWLPNISDRLFEADPIKIMEQLTTHMCIFLKHTVFQKFLVHSPQFLLSVLFSSFFFSLTTSVKIKSQCIVLFYGSNPSRLISAMTCRSADVHTLVEKVKNHLNIVQYFVCSFLIASRVKLYGFFLNTKISFMPEI